MVAAMHFVHFRVQLWKDTDSTVLYAEALWQRGIMALWQYDTQCNNLYRVQ